MGRLHKYIPVITKIEKWAGIGNIQMIRVTLIHVLAPVLCVLSNASVEAFPSMNKLFSADIVLMGTLLIVQF